MYKYEHVLYISECMCVCIYVSMYVCIYVFMYVCMFVCVYLSMLCLCRYVGIHIGK